MSLYVTSGMATAYIQDSLNRNTLGYQKYMDQLSSGSKLTSDFNDSISVSKVASVANQISVVAQATDNIKEGNDLLMMAESYQGDVLKNLQRIRDLAEQAANETYTPENKDAILSEIRTRLNYINNTASSANFNGANLLDGSNPNLALQIGVSSANSLIVGSALIDARPNVLGGDITLGPGVTGATWNNAAVNAYITKIDNAIGTLTSASIQIGGFRNRLDMSTESLNNVNDKLNENKSLLSDADVASASSDIVKYQILQQASISILTQVNQVPSWTFSLLRGSQ